MSEINLVVIKIHPRCQNQNADEPDDVEYDVKRSILQKVLKSNELFATVSNNHSRKYKHACFCSKLNVLPDVMEHVVTFDGNSSLALIVHIKSHSH